MMVEICVNVAITRSRGIRPSVARQMSIESALIADNVGD